MRTFRAALCELVDERRNLADGGFIFKYTTSSLVYIEIYRNAMQYELTEKFIDGSYDFINLVFAFPYRCLFFFFFFLERGTF